MGYVCIGTTIVVILIVILGIISQSMGCLVGILRLFGVNLATTENDGTGRQIWGNCPYCGRQGIGVQPPMQQCPQCGKPVYVDNGKLIQKQ